MVSVKADDRRRVQLPDAKPGQVFAYSSDGEGRIVLLKLDPKAGQPEASPLDGLKPLSKAVLDKLYRERPANDGIEDIEQIMANQSHGES